ncbi:protein translocase subunit SecF [Desulfovibrio aerotolerans]|uniref:Protein-export membrane protein SecF n=1 Tax=Solidesulfovibrio aerotolerans TaxID=295255 RepID=A0A7C9IKB6_9BACT|nr:protein translocase subunit SecF [Solidesulfovibrio aerotolerans]MYL82825.1 protein translocase subunit SecF [Solidesulfovibrio aerotolerans]
MVLELIRPGTNINFLKYRKLAYLISAAIILAGVVSLAVKGGPRFGVDFSGGLSIQVRFAKTMDVEQIAKAVEGVGLENIVVQRFGQDDGNEFLIRASDHEINQETVRTSIESALAKNLPDSGYAVQRLEMVGPKVGADLRGKALEAIFYSVLLIAIYISGRFEQRWMAAGLMAAGLSGGIYLLKLVGASTVWLIVAAMAITLVLCFVMRLKYALGAVVADLHDILITIAVFSLLDLEFDLTIVAALLTILGYSLNDTIIVYDRIREKLRGVDKSMPFEQVINQSVNETLSRTILTAGTTLITVSCLFFLGGPVIHDFSLAMLIGILAGTYSSVFVASPILLDLGSGLNKPAPAEPTSGPRVNAARA